MEDPAPDLTPPVVCGDPYDEWCRVPSLPPPPFLLFFVLSPHVWSRNDHATQRLLAPGFELVRTIHKHTLNERTTEVSPPPTLSPPHQPFVFAFSSK